MSDISLTQAFVGGLFALLGAFAGAALTRQTEYEKWLRQEKSLAFAEFLRQLHDTRQAVADAYYGPVQDENARGMNATECFVRLQKNIGIARLYMTEETRVQFSALLKELWLNCTGKGGPADRAIQIRDLMETIQALIENQLNAMPWQIRLLK